MSLSLNVKSLKGRPPSHPLLLTLEQQDATIGRQDDNRWVLPDPEQFVSSHHARIEYRESNYFLIDTSTNGVFINHSDAPLGSGNRIQLKNGDIVTIGEYEIVVALAESHAQGNADPIPDALKHDDADGFFDDPFAGLGADPIGRIIGQEAPLPSDWNEVVDSAPPDPPLSTTPDVEPDGSEHARPKDQLRTREPDDAFALDEAFPPKQEKPIDENTPSGDTPCGDTPSGDTPSGDTPSGDPTTSIDEAGPLHEAIIQKLIEGARIADPSTARLLQQPDTFLFIGTIIRTAIQGAMDTLMVRAQLKNEMRLDVTTIRPDRNNPIKFSVNADEALARLLTSRDRGYLPPEQAIEEVFDDIKAHQIAVLAGMQTALQSLLQRFDPQTLERRLQRQSPISASIPIHKQAQLWRLFKQLHAEIDQEAETNFYRLFGQAFSQAYDEQIRQLKPARKGGSIE